MLGKQVCRLRGHNWGRNLIFLAEREIICILIPLPRKKKVLDFNCSFLFRLPTRHSSKNFPALGGDFRNFAGFEQSYPVQRSMDLEGIICHRSIIKLSQHVCLQSKVSWLQELKSWSAQKCCMSWMPGRSIPFAEFFLLEQTM